MISMAHPRCVFSRRVKKVMYQISDLNSIYLLSDSCSVVLSVFLCLFARCCCRCRLPCESPHDSSLADITSTSFFNIMSSSSSSVRGRVWKAGREGRGGMFNLPLSLSSRFIRRGTRYLNPKRFKLKMMWSLSMALPSREWTLPLTVITVTRPTPEILFTKSRVLFKAYVWARWCKFVVFEDVML